MWVSRLAVLFVALSALPACDGGSEDSGEAVVTHVDVTESSFRCITDMTKVRGFYVDNLVGDVAATVAIANNLEGNQFPPGSVVQLVPLEAMVKREAGFNAATNDWEFFALTASEEGTEIDTRGTTETVNAFGGNCFGCHAPAADHDFVCEQDHGCDPLPIGPEQFEALQNNDPRCD